MLGSPIFGNSYMVEFWFLESRFVLGALPDASNSFLKTGHFRPLGIWEFTFSS